MHYSQYLSPSFNETEVRRAFIDPFFKAPGWDVDNTLGYDERYKEVVHGDVVKVWKIGRAVALDRSRIEEKLNDRE